MPTGFLIFKNVTAVQWLNRHSSFHSAFKEESKHYSNSTDCQDTNEGPSVTGIPDINLNNFPAGNLKNKVWNVKMDVLQIFSVFETKAYTHLLNNIVRNREHS